MKKLQISSLIVLLILSVILSGCTKTNGDNEFNGGVILDYDDKTLDSRFGFMHPDDFQDMIDLGIFWQRPHPGPFIWGQIETKSSNFNWNDCDKEVKISQQYGVNIIATIWPFADWDQKSCRSKAGSLSSMIFSELGKYRQKPCDMDAYSIFVTKLVERYDGDGVDDMSGLSVPIKYWEVSNEPSMQEEFHTFFAGSAEDYFDILNATYQAVKKADSEAKVLKGGMAGVMEDNTDFWEDIIDLDGTNYFDIGNIHSINSQSDGVNAPEYKEFLDEMEINKSFWVTEVELGEMDIDKENYKGIDMSDSLITNFVIAFHCGAEKIFHPGISKSKLEGNKESTYNSLKTIIQKIDFFKSVEKLNENQYKFTLENKIVYILWGEANIPEEITGQVMVTDSNGTETIKDATDIVLSDSPIFVELVTN